MIAKLSVNCGTGLKFQSPKSYSWYSIGQLWKVKNERLNFGSKSQSEFPVPDDGREENSKCMMHTSECHWGQLSSALSLACSSDSYVQYIRG